MRLLETHLLLKELQVFPTGFNVFIIICLHEVFHCSLNLVHDAILSLSIVFHSLVADESSDNYECKSAASYLNILIVSVLLKYMRSSCNTISHIVSRLRLTCRNTHKKKDCSQLIANQVGDASFLLYKMHEAAINELGILYTKGKPVEMT